MLIYFYIYSFLVSFFNMANQPDSVLNLFPTRATTRCFCILLKATLKPHFGHNNFAKVTFCLKYALSGLRQFLATEIPLKMIKNAFYFTLKACLVLKIFKFLS